MVMGKRGGGGGGGEEGVPLYHSPLITLSVLNIKPATGQISKWSRVLLSSTLEERTPNMVRSRDCMGTRLLLE